MKPRRVFSSTERTNRLSRGATVTTIRCREPGRARLILEPRGHLRTRLVIYRNGRNVEGPAQRVGIESRVGRRKLDLKAMTLPARSEEVFQSKAQARDDSRDDQADHHI